MASDGETEKPVKKRKKILALAPIAKPLAGKKLCKKTLKLDLASAGATKRPTCCVLVMTKPTMGELTQEEQEKLTLEYSQVVSEVNEVTATLFPCLIEMSDSNNPSSYRDLPAALWTGKILCFWIK